MALVTAYDRNTGEPKPRTPARWVGHPVLGPDLVLTHPEPPAPEPATAPDPDSPPDTPASRKEARRGRN